MYTVDTRNQSIPKKNLPKNQQPKVYYIGADSANTPEGSWRFFFPRVLYYSSQIEMFHLLASKKTDHCYLLFFLTLKWFLNRSFTTSSEPRPHLVPIDRSADMAKHQLLPSTTSSVVHVVPRLTWLEAKVPFQQSCPALLPLSIPLRLIHVFNHHRNNWSHHHRVSILLSVVLLEHLVVPKWTPWPPFNRFRSCTQL